ncbi:excinuclease ABC subunit C [Legionella beliardensis]|uniref:Excinuclease ABC subunit C n=1 Tax=Legionella beliardensis TaxID=91822 RepID=A0A378JRJ7_9GAMM|nr:GIY-YIG nuclease family protein [Legionella beliardensis]STX55788.1 excinuclease ABC subunit C [Legionella beliardensis]
MTELAQKKILIVDCQTTGMHPSTGYLLQIGWSIVEPSTSQTFDIEKWTLKLPNEELIPGKIKKMLRLTEAELSQSVEPKTVFDKFQQVLKELGSDPIVIAHYAQFEKNFLSQFYLEQVQMNELNFKLICSQKIAKRLLPHLPSHNLKAVAGFFKWPNTPKNDIHSHVSMTIHVWQQLLPKLLMANVSCYTSLQAWLATKGLNKKNVHYEYNIERLQRLKLSAKPGVYRMLAEDGTILYIGKATSLKARVNSYFRGVKNRDRRKLEMLAQVWNIETIECNTPLEAALLESDEIKRWSPSYNVLLKSESRRLIFYNYDYNKYSENKDSIYFNGPYKPYDAIVMIIELFNAFKAQLTIDYFDDSLSPEIMNKALILFFSTYGIENPAIEKLCMRQLFLIGYKLLKQFESMHGKGSFQKRWAQEKKKNLEEELVLEEKIARKIARMLIRAAEAKRKSRRIMRLYNSTFIIQSTQEKLTVINGELMDKATITPIPFNLFHYDRLSILLSALENKTIDLVPHFSLKHHL